MDGRIYLRDAPELHADRRRRHDQSLPDFELDMGYTLVAPNGAANSQRAQFAVNGAGFEFRLNGVAHLPRASPPSPIWPPTARETMAQRIDAALGRSTCPVQVNGNRVNLRGGCAGGSRPAPRPRHRPTCPPALSKASWASAGGIVVNVHSGMTREQVREAIALVMAGVYAGGDRAQIKTHNEIVRLVEAISR